MSATLSVQNLVQEGADSFKRGEKQRALLAFARAVVLDPDCELGWLWLAGLVTSDEEKRYCLQNAIQLNHTNIAAQNKLLSLGGKYAPARRPAIVTALISGEDPHLHLDMAPPQPQKTSLDQLTEQALTLSPTDRAELIARLARSLCRG